MASASISVKELDDITECPICCEALTDPRVLPCIHTYCLKCIDTWCRGKEPETEVACPLCMKKFPIPTSGVSCLPKNFFVMKLVNLRQLSSSESKQSPCEACLNEQDGGETGEVKSAIVFCLECQEKLCEDCDKTHRKLKGTRAHKILPLGHEIKPEEFRSKYPPSACETHPSKSLELFCFDCKLVICMMCYVEQHNSHKCSDISKVAGGFRQKIQRDPSRLNAGIKQCGDLVEKLQIQKREMLKQTTKVEKEICDKADQLKEMIERHKQQLLGELSTLRENRLKEIDGVCSDIERQSVTMQGLKKYIIDEVVKKGTVCDIVRTASSLHDRTDELLAFEFTEGTLAQMPHDIVRFKPSTAVIDDVRKSIGHILTIVTTAPWQKIAVKPSTQNSPILTQVIAQDSPVCAVTSLSNQLFVLRKSSKQVDVYDTKTLTLQCSLNRSDAGVSADLIPCGLAACSTNRCLYISYYKLTCCPRENSGAVYRVELSGCHAVKRWQVGGGPRGLSMTNHHHVLVSCENGDVLLEYTTRGSLVREIRLQCDTRPCHAVQISNGQFVVSGWCKFTDEYTVQIVDADGQVTQTYNQPAAETGPLNYPRCLFVTEGGLILVADTRNNRILRMNSSLSSSQELRLPIDGGLHNPCSLWLDESRGRLFVAATNSDLVADGKRVLVFENV